MLGAKLWCLFSADSGTLEDVAIRLEKVQGEVKHLQDKGEKVPRFPALRVAAPWPGVCSPPPCSPGLLWCHLQASFTASCGCLPCASPGATFCPP